MNQGKNVFRVQRERESPEVIEGLIEAHRGHTRPAVIKGLIDARRALKVNAEETC